MEYFAGLDVSMSETHVCVVTQDGTVIHEVRAPSTPADIVAALARVPACRRILFETGRMAPMLYHGLSQIGLPGGCVESRQAYQALKSLATHKTDRNDARGLAHLARIGFFKPVHRSQEAGRPAGHLGEPDPRPRRDLWGPTAPCAQSRLRSIAAVNARAVSWPTPNAHQPAARFGCSDHPSHVGVGRHDGGEHGSTRRNQTPHRGGQAGDPLARPQRVPVISERTACADNDPERFRRSREIGAYFGLVPRRYQSGEVDYTGSISKCGDRRVRILLYEAANVMLTRYRGTLKVKDWALAIAKRC